MTKGGKVSEGGLVQKKKGLQGGGGAVKRGQCQGKTTNNRGRSTPRSLCLLSVLSTLPSYLHTVI